jgi:phosphoglycerate dehydrogenase-like enzyme
MSVDAARVLHIYFAMVLQLMRPLRVALAVRVLVVDSSRALTAEGVVDSIATLLARLDVVSLCLLLLT